MMRIIPVERIKEYKGTGQNGEYCVGTWRVKNVVDNTEIVITAFTEVDSMLSSNPTLAMDAEIMIVAKSWLNPNTNVTQWFNDVKINSLVVPEKVQDTPGQVVQPIVNNSLNPFDSQGVSSDLPF